MLHNRGIAFKTLPSHALLGPLFGISLAAVLNRYVASAMHEARSMTDFLLLCAPLAGMLLSLALAARAFGPPWQRVD